MDALYDFGQEAQAREALEAAQDPARAWDFGPRKAFGFLRVFLKPPEPWLTLRGASAAVRTPDRARS
jgi:hypothetical protein